MEAKYSMELSWKEHNVDLKGLEVWLRANAGDDYCGNSAGVGLQLWFQEEPSEEIKEAINDKWEELDDEEHELCAGYKPLSQILSEKAAAKAAAIAAFALASGLSQEQINDLLG